MSKENTNSGKVAAFGENASAHGTTFIDNKADTIVFNQPGSVSLAALHQLPPPSGDFVGREKEMTVLLNALESGGVNISGLQGMGGIGKTALALKLAQQLEPRYPDAQFFLDLNGVSKQPLSPADVMTRIIRFIHPEAKLPEEESSLQAIYLSELKGKKALLLMDNAASPEQIEPLIPPKTCVLLVTSRFHFTLRGLGSINLDALEPKDAKQLLLKIAPRIGECADKIAELCGYLPLALEVAASTFHISVSLTPEDYVKRFSDTTKRLKLLDKVDASLSLSYELLDEKMQQNWRRLSVYPNTFDAAAVAALWEMSVDDTKDELDRLIFYSIVEWNETTRRYRLHDLVRLFAATRLNEEEFLTAKKVHSTYFCDLLFQAKELYNKGSEDIMRGLALFDIERENIEAGQRWAALLIGKDETATQLSMQYYNAGAYIIELRLHLRERITWLEVTLNAAHLLEDKIAMGYALGNLGIAHSNLGQQHKAIEFHLRRQMIARELGDRKSEGTAFLNLGTAYWYLGKSREAIEYYEQHLEIAREFDDRRGVCHALSGLGIAYSNLGELDKATEYYEQHLEIAREIGDKLNEEKALCNLGATYSDLGEAAKAIEYFEQGLRIALEIGYRRGEGIALGNLGAVYSDLGEYRKAIELYEQSLTIALELGDLLNEGNALWNAAFTYNQLDDQAQAIYLAEKALAIYEQIESPEASKVHLKLAEWKSELA